MDQLSVYSATNVYSKRCLIRVANISMLISFGETVSIITAMLDASRIRDQDTSADGLTLIAVGGSN